MSETPFYATVMGRRFYEGTVPKLVEELALLNRNLTRLVDALDPEPEQGPVADEGQSDDL